MLDGEVVKGCEHCYDLEDMGFSYRTNYTRDWFEYSDRGEEIVPKDLNKANGMDIE